MDQVDKKEQTIAMVNKYKAMYQMYMDSLTPHVKYRWSALGIGLVLFFLRVAYGEGWYVVCYGLGIYLLNQFLSFLTPKFDVSLQQDEENNELESGERVDEFRPFIRRLPEFKFWHNSMRALALCSSLTLFRIFDIPVFWPILVMYFILLFALTMRRQIQHMIKYKYIPLDIGKKRYAAKE
ncbi:LAME_0E10242g1_1 [Lachancea meyersii CBS 8951]|uniref:Protein RER1 n=1 Tax=Lachancea meyersii CBS 8951 TaxID=1266667 RepID=A0A1G4JJX4_9SACH|nr:LAME_0E10242g1_1 [Lachancea meyersii CBS 8951]